MEKLSMAIYRRRLAETAARLLIAFIVLALITCPFLVPQNILIIIIGVIALIGSIIVWFLIRNKFVAEHAPHLVILASFLSIMPLVVLSGGVHSHFIFLFPVSPMMTGLLINARAAHIVAGVLVIAIILLALFNGLLPNLEIFVDNIDQTLIRAYWLILATVITSIFVYYYDHLSNHFNTYLRDLAFHDSLTQIPNRRSIQEALELAQTASWRNRSWLAVMMIDIDHFKHVNDKYGHALGDKCLVEVASCLKNNVRRNEDIVARYGGEEFVAMFPGVKPERMEQIAEHLRREIEQLEIKSDEGESVRLTVTIGCSCRQGSSRIPAIEILTEADEAMYLGKEQGRNRVVVADNRDAGNDT